MPILGNGSNASMTSGSLIDISDIKGRIGGHMRWKGF